MPQNRLLTMLLYIESKNQKSKQPVLDEKTKKMTAAFKDSKGTGVAFSDRKFLDGATTFGFHACICGAHSTSVDYLLPGGIVTNYLCVHYLAWHRSEVPQAEIDKIDLLPNKFAEPTPELLQ